MPRNTKFYFLCGLLLALICLALKTSALSQGAKNRLVVYESSPNEPIEIKIKDFPFGNTPITFGKAFASDIDWAKSIRLQVKNTSGKVISYIEIGIKFPRHGRTDEVINIPLKLGEMPRSEAPVVDALPPDGEATLVVPEDVYEATKRLLESDNNMSDARRVIVVTEYVFFNDRTGWHLGQTLYPSKTQKDRWVPAGSPEAGSAINKETKQGRNWIAKVQCDFTKDGTADYYCCKNPSGFGNCFVLGDKIFYMGRNQGDKIRNNSATCPCDATKSCIYLTIVRCLGPNPNIIFEVAAY